MAITDFADLSIAIGSKRPGDKVSVTYVRNGKENMTTVTLKDQKGGTSTRTKADLSVTEKSELNSNLLMRDLKQITD